MEELRTMAFRDILERCEDNENFLKLMEEHQDAMTVWADVFAYWMEEKNGTIAALAAYCKVTRNTARQWKQKIPTKREQVVGIGMYWGFQLEQINRLLTRNAKYPALYVKNPEDAIFIYLIHNKKDYSMYEFYMEEYRKMQEEKEPEQKYLDGTEEKTFELNAALLEVMGDQEFKKFLEEHMEVFEGRNRKLYKFLEEYFKLEERNINSLVDDEKLKNAYNNAFSHLKRKGIVPRRNLLIAMGIHLTMPVEDINRMLELAGMEALCPKDRIESAVIFVLEDLYLNDSVLFSDAGRKLTAGLEELIDRCCPDIVWNEEACSFQNIEDVLVQKKKSGAPDIEKFYEEGELESVADYVKRRIRELELREPEEDLELFLQLL